MRKKVFGFLVSAWALGLLGGSGVRAQQTADMIFYNGKIVTVDDDSFTSRLGTIAKAMHVKDGKVLHLGNNAPIRAMAGPNAARGSQSFVMAGSSARTLCTYVVEFISQESAVRGEEGRPAPDNHLGERRF